MSLRSRLTVAASAAVAVAVVLGSALLFVATRRALYDEVDHTLRERARVMANAARTSSQGATGNPGPGGRTTQTTFLPPRLRPRPGLPPPTTPAAQVAPRANADFPYLQLVADDGSVSVSETSVGSLPVPDEVQEVAAGRRRSYIFTTSVDGDRTRVLAVPSERGQALEVGRSLGEVDAVLADLRLVLVIVTAGGIVLAAGLGLIVATTAMRPVQRLTETAERVTETRDLNERIEVHGNDEVGRLAASFNTMLAALDESVRAQRSLVADASHELRTPLTSLRTNIEVLMRDGLAPADRERLARDVDGQIIELSGLVGDLIELARGEEQVTAVEDVALDEIVERAVTAARGHWAGVTFVTDLSASTVAGVPERIYRAVVNLLDNAAKYSPPGSVVEVVVRDGEVGVRDHGPGIADADKVRVFDRFWRAANARGVTGSGLGLAIVKQVAESHGGRAWVADAPGGGADFRLLLPALA